MATVEEQAATIQLLQQQLADAQRLLTERGANANPPDAAQGNPPASGTPRPEVEEINSTPKLPPFWHKNPSLWFPHDARGPKAPKRHSSSPEKLDLNSLRSLYLKQHFQMIYPITADLNAKPM
ncbi:hypothetical protein TcasGA2_TC005258 [Tribolium castaneum]|uniref:Uncharacterized protein n=1 Tax=Tribolium castaneum TaxID=7070 RepID=D7EK41_TRICA|nr:hypothetical protein TcasGA2_TC005258 [Tribolium castaneum]